MKNDELWDNDAETSEGEMKGVAYTAISLIGGLLTLGVSLLIIFLS